MCSQCVSLQVRNYLYRMQIAITTRRLIESNEFDERGTYVCAPVLHRCDGLENNTYNDGNFYFGTTFFNSFKWPQSEQSTKAHYVVHTLFQKVGNKNQAHVSLQQLINPLWAESSSKKPYSVRLRHTIIHGKSVNCIMAYASHISHPNAKIHFHCREL